ncbi:hypothetical protein AC792_03860 [Arthrobacter sp. RIT-PI-e]|nr:hypothetical protein AC792_03860 [Arthrobacter sp. RIT-PI-e]
MKKRTLMMAGTSAVAALLGVTALIGTTTSVPDDFPLAAESQHSTHGSVESGVASAEPGTEATHDHGVDPAGSAPAADEQGDDLQLSAISPSERTSDNAAPGRPGGNASDTAPGRTGGNGSKPPAPGNAAGAPGQEVRVAPLPELPAAAGNNNGKGKPQSLGEALAKPHGIAAAGVGPAGPGVNKGTAKQAPGLQMRSLARGEQDAGVNDAARTGGCAPGYGDGRSCLPVAPPSAAQHSGHGAEIAWTCEELLTLFPEGIPLQVPGTDPLGLDEDGNGVACA